MQKGFNKSGKSDAKGDGKLVMEGTQMEDLRSTHAPFALHFRDHDRQ